jgi:demethylmenaquinone methyltransferase / 2-methoxy-6-polyprenyl-1,4-benzoquinol methylase
MPVDKSPAAIAGMFDAIAGRYDVLNTVLSGGLDRYWRFRAIRSLALTGRERLLDVCTGTADVALAGARAAKGAARVVGVDFAAAMLGHGRTKVTAHGLDARVQLVRGDAMRLPVADAAVDAVPLAVGLRHGERPDAAGAEQLRVRRPGGRNHVLPRIGRAVSGHTKAYDYLPRSVGSFPSGDGFARILRDAGFSQVSAKPLSLGIVYLYTAVKADARPAL